MLFYGHECYACKHDLLNLCHIKLMIFFSCIWLVDFERYDWHTSHSEIYIQTHVCKYSTSSSQTSNMKRHMKAAFRFLSDYKRFLILVLTPILLSALLPNYEALNLTQKVSCCIFCKLPFLYIDLFILNKLFFLQACNCLYMLLLMAVFWCTETLPLPVTALFPLFLAPSLGILKASVVCLNYFKVGLA